MPKNENDVEKYKGKRARNWTLIIYPESAPQNWRGILDDEHIMWVESPLHDRDTNPDGEKKKAHWHILLTFEGKKSYRQIKEIADELNSPIPKPVQSAKGLVRYMIHMDNPEKYQYDKSEIIGHGGADVSSYFELSATRKLDILNDIVSYVRANGITELTELTYYAQDNDMDWFDVIAHNTIFLRALLASARHVRIGEDTSQVSNRNAEVLDMHRQGMSIRKIAETVGISKSMVSYILNN